MSARRAGFVAAAEEQDKQSGDEREGQGGAGEGEALSQPTAPGTGWGGAASNPADSRFRAIARIAAVAARERERVLDAGCGTGRNPPGLLAAGAVVTGVDFSPGMPRVARRQHPDVPFTQADLRSGWPFLGGAFGVVLCALVGEHLDRLDDVTREMRPVLAPGGRAIFSVYHPAMAAAGREANFERDGTEYRLGAVQHTLDDYAAAFEQARFGQITVDEYAGDEELVRVEPSAASFLGFPLLVVIQAR